MAGTPGSMECRLRTTSVVWEQKESLVTKPTGAISCVCYLTLKHALQKWERGTLLDKDVVSWKVNLPSEFQLPMLVSGVITALWLQSPHSVLWLVLQRVCAQTCSLLSSFKHFTIVYSCCRWKSHGWSPCVLVPESVRQGPGEDCGHGLQSRGKSPPPPASSAWGVGDAIAAGSLLFCSR